MTITVDVAAAEGPPQPLADTPIVACVAIPSGKVMVLLAPVPLTTVPFNVQV
jgi:hypothetical protein